MSAQAAIATLKKPSDILTKWLVISSPTEEEEEVGQEKAKPIRVALRPSPAPAPTFAALDRQRVVQIGLGAEHGVLLTDAGNCFTWGDNRYGQLGRRPCRKEENDEPFPVLELLGYEVSQVASGKHHCLALTCSGNVFAWGRNKSGQLGNGDIRDRVTPTPVLDGQKVDSRQGDPQAEQWLGGKPTVDDPKKIITIGAGMNSSLAVARDSSVYQWGAISDKFKEESKEAGQGSGDKRFAVSKYYPYLVARGHDFRTQLRQSRVSITETACKVLERLDPKHRDQIPDQVRSIRNQKLDLGNRRQQILEKSKNVKEKRSKGAEADVSEMSSISDTMSSINREILALEHEIQMYEKNLHSVVKQQNHQREQLQDLHQLAARLSASEDNMSVKLYSAKKANQPNERRSLEKQLADIRELMDANGNTRMTLLDQRAETDKDKQHLQNLLQEKKKQIEDRRARLRLIDELKEKPNAPKGGDKSLINEMKKLRDIVANAFDKGLLTKPTSRDKAGKGDDFLPMKAMEEEDYEELNRVEAIVKQLPELFAATDRPENIQRGIEIMNELLRLRRAWTKMNLDRHFADDQNMSTFFKGAKKPSFDGGLGVSETAGPSQRS